MKYINDSINEFASALKEERRPQLNKNGYWTEGNRFQIAYSKIFKKKYLQKVASRFIMCMSRLEKIPILFESPQNIDFTGFIEASLILESRLKTTFPALYFQLKRQRIGLGYRLEKSNGGLDKSLPDSPNLENLIEEATKWKQSQAIFWRKSLSERELNKLKAACCYSMFIDLLNENKGLKEEFFLWTLREGLPVEPFIEFPALQIRLVLARLSGRIGRMGGENLKILKEKNSHTNQVEKILVLPFEGQLVNILEEQREVVFQGKYRLTVKEVLEVFKQKPYQAGNLEYFAQGITNWNPHRLGWWNAETGTYELIDLDQPDWWFQLPLFEILTLKEAQLRYGKQADGNRWIVIAKASRQYLNLHYDKNHAYLEIAIPIGSRSYAIYDFGKVATRFPATNWEEVKTFTITVLATIAYPDENVYFSHRQHVGYCFDLKPATALRLMNHICEDMKQSRVGNVVFQIESENCGQWIQNLLEENLGKEAVPNLFRIPLLETDATGWVGKTFELIRKLPAYTHAKILGLIHYPLGSYKGRWVVDRKGQKSWKSLNTNTYWQDGIIHLPARLHRQREDPKNGTDTYVQEELFD